MEEHCVKVVIPNGKVAKWNDNGLLQLFDEKPNVIKRIKTFDDAVQELGNYNIFVKEYNYYISHNPIDDNNVDIMAYIKLRIIVAALNEGFKPQFKKDEERWIPWFKFYSEDELVGKSNKWKDDCALNLLMLDDGSNGGIVYLYSNYSCSRSLADTSVQLALKSEALANYCGKQFAPLWAEYYTGKVCKPWREVTDD